jgi:hypothetical protein
VKKTDKSAKGYNEKNPAQPAADMTPDKNMEKKTYLPGTTPNEKLSIPERKLKKDKK